MRRATATERRERTPARRIPLQRRPGPLRPGHTTRRTPARSHWPRAGLAAPEPRPPRGGVRAELEWGFERGDQVELDRRSDGRSGRHRSGSVHSDGHDGLRRGGRGRGDRRREGVDHGNGYGTRGGVLLRTAYRHAEHLARRILLGRCHDRRRRDHRCSRSGYRRAHGLRPARQPVLLGEHRRRPVGERVGWGGGGLRLLRGRGLALSLLARRGSGQDIDGRSGHRAADFGTVELGGHGTSQRVLHEPHRQRVRPP